MNLHCKIVIISVILISLSHGDKIKGGNSKFLSEFNDWWQEMSEMKPVKCRSDVKLDSDHNFVPILDSFSCRPGDEQSSYYFRGDIVDNQFYGPGKFSLNKPNKNFNTVDTCFTLYPVRSLDIVSIVSTFKNGKPHSNAKIYTAANVTIVTEFDHGIIKGLFRQWNSNNELEYLGNFLGDNFQGRCWKNKNGIFLFGSCNIKHFKKGSWNWALDFEALTIVNDTEIFAGEIWPYNGILGNARKAIVEESSLKNCVLEPKFDRILDQVWSIAMESGELGSLASYPFCKSEMSSSAQENLKNWYSQVRHTDRDIFWNSVPYEEDLDENATELVSNIEHIEDKKFSCKVLRKDSLCHVQEGHVDENGKLQGPTVLKVINSPIFPVVNHKIHLIYGIADGSVFSGPIMLQLANTLHINARCKENVLHGPAILMGATAAYKLEANLTMDRVQPDRFGWFAGFKNGRPQGHVWLATLGGGFLYGELNEELEFTGDDLAWIYPDFKHAIVGRFKDRVLESGRVAKIVSESCNQFGVKVLQFSNPEGPELFYNPPTNSSFGGVPGFQDPYEEEAVLIAESGIPNSGKGLFANRFMEKGTLASIYTGYRYLTKDEIETYRDRYMGNVSLSDDDRRRALKYSINLGSTGASMHIPIELTNGPELDLPTFGAMVNCGFEPNCNFHVLEHPIWGTIEGVFTMRDVAKGEELLVDYGYSPLEFPYDYLWYHKAKKEFMESNPEKLLKT